MTSLTSFYTGLYGLSVTGVQRTLTAPPKKLDDADLPTLWVDSATYGNTREGTGADRDGFALLTAQIIVCTEAIVQGTTIENMTETLTIADALHDALENADIAIGALNYEITITVHEKAGIQYHALEVNVEAIG